MGGVGLLVKGVFLASNTGSKLENIPLWLLQQIMKLACFCPFSKGLLAGLENMEITALFSSVNFKWL